MAATGSFDLEGARDTGRTVVTADGNWLISAPHLLGMDLSERADAPDFAYPATGNPDRVIRVAPSDGKVDPFELDGLSLTEFTPGFSYRLGGTITISGQGADGAAPVATVAVRDFSQGTSSYDTPYRIDLDGTAFDDAKIDAFSITFDPDWWYYLSLSPRGAGLSGFEVHEAPRAAQTSSAYDTVLTGNDDGEVLSGGAGRDLVFANGGDDIVWAGAVDASDDKVLGGTGNDLLGGGAGNDILAGGLGADTLWGGTGDDTLRGDDGDDILGGGAGGDRLDGGAGDDLLCGGDEDSADSLAGGTGDDTLYAGGGADTLAGGADDDALFAGTGDDAIDGGDGDDLIFNGAGADTVSGGDGADTIWGGAGDDRLFGGADADVFAFVAGAGQDTVRAFDVFEDTLRLDGVAEADVSIETLGTDVHVAFGDTGILLEGIAFADYDTGDILFT